MCEVTLTRGQSLSHRARLYGMTHLYKKSDCLERRANSVLVSPISAHIYFKFVFLEKEKNRKKKIKKNKKDSTSVYSMG